MKLTILVAGGTGNLGGKIIKALMARGAEVHAPVRATADDAKVERLEREGVKVFKIDMSNKEEVARACEGASCVVSALQGLRDVIVDAQTVLLEAARAAGVPRFIPSDFSLDFTKLAPGENRNFDLRREFQTRLDDSSISATSIFNAAFAEILGYGTPILDLKKKTVGYWGDNSDWRLDFTTMDDTANFTAAAALDSSTPRYLNIASFQITPKELAALAGEATNSAFNLVNMGSLEELAAYAKSERAADPDGEEELYPKWQNTQYMHGMFSAHHETLDNNRYPDIKWTSGNEFIKQIIR